MDLNYGGHTRIECANQTADAIAALLYYFAEPEPFVYSLVDYLLLLSFEESMITIDFEPQQGARRCVLKTMSDQEIAFRGLVDGTRRDTTVERHSWAALEKWGVYFTIKKWTEIEGPPSDTLLQEIDSRLQSHFPASYNGICHLILEFCGRESREDTAITAYEPAAIRDEITNHYLERFRAAYWNRVIAPFSLPASTLRTVSPVSNDGTDDHLPLNLFALVRYLPETTYEREVKQENGSLRRNYAMRLMLADSQVDWLSARSGKSRDEIVRIFRQPGDQARYWPADIVFRSGTVYSGVKAEDRKSRATGPRDPDEEDRDRLEDEFYAAFGPEARIVYFPIHVGGTPWITLYSLSSAERAMDWMHFLHLYRQVIPRIAEQLREFARQAFIQALEEAIQVPIREQAKWSTKQIDQINRSWRETSLVFPFPVPQIQRLATDSHNAGVQKSAFTIGDAAYEIGFTDAHPYFPSDVDFGQLTEAIKSDLTGRIRNEIVSRYERRMLQLYGVLDLAHELKNAILETHWDELRKELVITPIEELFRSDYPVRLRRGLSHMLWPAALVGLVSNLGKIDLIGDELESFRETHLENGNAFRYDAWNVQERYRESVRYLTKYLARLKWPAHHPMSIREYVGPAPLDQAVAYSKLDDLLLHAEEIPDALLELHKLDFPPLKDGIIETQGTRFAVASLLSEPIRNAAAAMMSNTGRSVPSPTLIWSVHAQEHEVTVWIANTFPSDARVDALLWSTSIELVNALGRMLGIGSVDAPRAVNALHDDIQLIVTVVHLRPDRLGYGPNHTRTVENPSPRTPFLP